VNSLGQLDCAFFRAGASDELGQTEQLGPEIDVLRFGGAQVDQYLGFALLEAT